MYECCKVAVCANGVCMFGCKCVCVTQRHTKYDLCMSCRCCCWWSFAVFPELRDVMIYRRVSCMCVCVCVLSYIYVYIDIYGMN